MKKLYYVRHGFSLSNAQNTFAGVTDVPLTDAGREQARLAGQKIATSKIHIDLIICSTLGRAEETAQIIAKEIAYPQEKIQSCTLFLERNFGELEGVNHETFFKDHIYKDVDNAMGAETLKDLQDRALMALNYAKSSTQGTALVVSHGAFGRAFRRVIENKPYTNEYIGPLLLIRNAEVLELI